MKTTLIKIIDSMPIPTPEQGDRAVTLSLSFVAGFIFAIIIFGL